MQSIDDIFDGRVLRRLAAASVAAACLMPGAEARTVTWTGGGDGSTWSDGANWGGTAPADGDDVRVGATTARAPSLRRGGSRLSRPTTARAS